MAPEINASYSGMKDWTQQQGIKTHIGEQLHEAKNSFEKASILAEYKDVAPKNLESSYSIMSEENASDSAKYSESISAFSINEIGTKDEDDNNLLSLDEYKKAKLQELEELNEILKVETTQEMEIDTLTESHLLFSIIDVSGDKSIDFNELETYYKEMDKYSDNSLNAAADGKVDIEQKMGYDEALVAKYFSESEIQMVKDAYTEYLNMK